MRTEALATIGAAAVGLIGAAPAGATPPTMEFDTLDLRPDGSFTYVRDPGKSGQDRFRYQVFDSGGRQGNIAYAWIRP
jgi:hypothetical protein